ncbi:MAG: hypothetical protein PHZ14_07110, partial [Sulfuricella sp.]|nr:hypothetical protein [Sulfuricella sp.]
HPTSAHTYWLYFFKERLLLLFSYRFSPQREVRIIQSPFAASRSFLSLSSCFVAMICNEGAHLTGLNFFVKPFIFAPPGGFHCFALPSRGAHYTGLGTVVKTYFQLCKKSIAQP